MLSTGYFLIYRKEIIKIQSFHIYILLSFSAAMKKNNTKKTHPLVRLRRKSRLLWKFTKTSVLDSPWYGRTLFMMALFLLILKMFLMHEAYGAILASNHFLVTVMNYISILSSDFMIVGLVFVGAFLNAMFRHRILRWVINSISLFLMLLYVSDMFSIYYFQSRFYLFDMLQFFSIKNSVTYVMYPFVWAFFFVGILFILFLVVQRWFPVIRQKNMHLRAALVFLGVCTFFSIVNLTSLTDFHFRDNVLSINLQEVSTVLGDTSVNTALEKPYTDYFTPFVGQKRTGDVIVIFAESFSVVDSLKMGGLHNNLS